MFLVNVNIISLSDNLILKVQPLKFKSGLLARLAIKRFCVRTRPPLAQRISSIAWITRSTR